MRIVAALLIVWEPLRFATEALIVLPTIAYRGPAAAIELVVHGLVAALAAAAGFALLNAAPDGRRLAVLAVIASFLRLVQSLYWSALPNNTPPGDEPWLLAVSLIIGLVAVAVIRRSAR